VLVGSRLRVGELQSELRHLTRQGRDLLVENGDLALLKGELGLHRRVSGGANLGRQTRLVVHAAILPPTTDWFTLAERLLFVVSLLKHVVSTVIFQVPGSNNVGKANGFSSSSKR